MDNWQASANLQVRKKSPPADKRLCRGGFFDSNRKPSPCLIVGMLLGSLILVVSAGLGYLPHGKHLNDPIFLALSFGMITRGFLYFNWNGLFLTVGAFSAFGFFAWLGVTISANRKKRIRPDDIRRVSYLGVLFAYIPVWLQRIDSFNLLLWYGMASILGLFLADFVGRLALKTARYFD
jgi:hypothetical protein